MTAETTMDCAIAVACRGQLVSGATDAPPALWWSFGKTVLAAAALALVRDGRLDLDARMPDHDFTLGEVLGHRAGLPDYGGMPRYHAAVAAGETPWTADEFLARAGADNLRWPERGTFHYSNIGYLLVRRLIETTTGATLQAALARLVFDPLDIGGVRVMETPGDLAATLWGNSQNYHPGWVAHGLLAGPPAAAALLLDRMLAGDALPAALLARMLDGVPAGGPFPGRPWIKASYGLGLMMDLAGSAGRQHGHTGKGHTTAAVYHFPDLSPPRAIAAFARDGDVGNVERAVLETARASQP